VRVLDQKLAVHDKVTIVIRALLISPSIEPEDCIREEPEGFAARVLLRLLAHKVRPQVDDGRQDRGD
jgi:hypothetical protein